MSVVYGCVLSLNRSIDACYQMQRVMLILTMVQFGFSRLEIRVCHLANRSRAREL